jgi:hypothetical protein
MSDRAKAQDSRDALESDTGDGAYRFNADGVNLLFVMMTGSCYTTPTEQHNNRSKQPMSANSRQEPTINRRQRPIMPATAA